MTIMTHPFKPTRNEKVNMMQDPSETKKNLILTDLIGDTHFDREP